MKKFYYGLIPNNYHLQKIKNILILFIPIKEFINVTSLVKADLLLSDAYFLMGAHLNKGRFYTDSLLLQTNFSKLDKGWDSILVSGYKQAKFKSSIRFIRAKIL